MSRKNKLKTLTERGNGFGVIFAGVDFSHDNLVATAVARFSTIVAAEKKKVFLRLYLCVNKLFLRFFNHYFHDKIFEHTWEPPRQRDKRGQSFRAASVC